MIDLLGAAELLNRYFSFGGLVLAVEVLAANFDNIKTLAADFFGNRQAGIHSNIADADAAIGGAGFARYIGNISINSIAKFWLIFGRNTLIRYSLKNNFKLSIFVRYRLAKSNFLHRLRVRIIAPTPIPIRETRLTHYAILYLAAVDFVARISSSHAFGRYFFV